MRVEDAIELAKRHAQLNPQPYVTEDFEPHQWVIQAILEAGASVEEKQPVRWYSTDKLAPHSLSTPISTTGAALYDMWSQRHLARGVVLDPWNTLPQFDREMWGMLAVELLY